MIVHILFYGAGLCGKVNFPVDHKWVHSSNRKKATCPKCLAVHAKLGSVLTDTDAPSSIQHRELKDPKPRVPPPEPKPELPPGEYEPEDDEEKKYIEWAKIIAAGTKMPLYVVSLKNVGQFWRGNVKYAIQIDDDPYRSRTKVMPDGTVWPDCEELT